MSLFLEWEQVCLYSFSGSKYAFIPLVGASMPLFLEWEQVYLYILSGSKYTGSMLTLGASVSGSKRIWEQVHLRASVSESKCVWEQRLPYLLIWLPW